jgi:hypothetical protein
MASSSDLYNAIVALSPDVYWTLDEASGNAIQQGSSTVSDLAFSGSFTQAETELIPGDSTKFVSLTGGKGTATRGNLTLPFGSFSATFLIKVPGAPQENAGIFSVGAAGETTATNYQILYRFNTYPVMHIFWEFGSSGSDVILSPQTRLYRDIYDGTQFETKHVTLVKDSVGKTVSTYINGFLRETLSYSSEPSGGTSTSFFIGGVASAAPAETLTMSMGHFAFFQKVLIPQEVVDLAKASGFMAADYQLGVAELEVSSQDSEDWASAQDIKQKLEYAANKRLTISLDPLIDPSLLAGSEAYAIE